MFDFGDRPGLLFVWATLLPLASFTLLLLVAGVRWMLRPYARESAGARAVFEALGGEVVGKGPAYVALGAIALAFVCSFAGFTIYLSEHASNETQIAQYERGIEAKLHHADEHHEHKHAKEEHKHKEGEDHKHKHEHKHDGKAKDGHGDVHAEVQAIEKKIAEIEGRWAGSVIWASVTPRLSDPSSITTNLETDPGHANILKLGYRIDMLSAIMFVMVTFVATLIHLFSTGYMSEELQKQVEDHHVHVHDADDKIHSSMAFGHHGEEHGHGDHGHGHFKRRGRFGRFFMFLSLFCFSMLNLLLADNLFQIFVSWELVGICSFLLISFYYERQSASNAANKAFIVNRVGDAGFIIGLLIVWAYIGSFNFQEIFQRVRYSVPGAGHGHEAHAAPADPGKKQGDEAKAAPGGHGHGGHKHGHGAHDKDALRANRFLLAELDHLHDDHGHFRVLGENARHGNYVLLFPRADHHVHLSEYGNSITAYERPEWDQFGYMPYWLLVVAGLGIFLGCVGKSAQFPLQVWLPDAMEGPTPVSALIHAATMVAAGVYLVGRCFPLFLPEVTLTIAYVGGITLFVAATIAIVVTDIKKVLAYSTVSQLGYMMLALGVGGWAAGLFHLLTHAFFKALLFLGSGSVIYGCHHEQDMRKMGGLYPKMKITALTMLMGVLAIAGMPLFSGWFSKDAVLASALAFVQHGNEHHFLLFLLPLVTAGITTFYMFRMWFMTFTGEPRDAHVYEHAHESPWEMTTPLILLAILSVCVGWGIPEVNPRTGQMNSLAESSWVEHQLHHAQPQSVEADFGYYADAAQFARLHELAGAAALGMVVLGLAFAASMYYYRLLDPAEAQAQFPAVHRFLEHKWYFDEVYSAMLVRPAVIVSRWCRDFDTYVVDALVNAFGRAGVLVSFWSGRFDRGIVDGFVNLIADASYATGAWLRNWQTGYLRTYVLFLVLAAVGMWLVLYGLLLPALAGG